MAKPKWSLSKTALVIVGVPFLAQICLLTALIVLQLESARQLDRLAKPIEINADLSVILRQVITVWVAVDSHEDASSFMSSEFGEQRRNLERAVASLKTRVQNDSKAMSVLDGITRAMDDCKSLDETMTDAVFSNDRTPNIENALEQQVIAKFNGVASAIGRLPKLMDVETKRARVPLAALSEVDHAYSTVLISGILIQLLLTAAFLLHFRGDLKKRVEIILDNSYRMASASPLHSISEREDELGEVDRAFHVMASELKESQEIDRMIIANSQAVLCVINERLALEDVSDSVIEMLGYHPDELLEFKAVGLFYPDDMPDFACVLQKVQSGEVTGFNARCLRKDGTLIDTEWALEWSQSDRQYYCAIHDDTERKFLERRRHMLVEMITNELQGPIAQAASVIERLSDPSICEINSKGLSLMNNSVNAARRMSLLVNDLLDMELLEQGQITLQCNSHSMNTIAEQSIYVVANLAEQYGVSVQTQIPADARVYADADRLCQILINLLSNAIKFSSTDSVVLVEFSESEQTTEVRVKDQGRGIPANVQRELFRAFKQVEISDSKEKGGTGLGLSICKSLVELHGGKISVESLEGHGSTFTVSLPRNAARLVP